MQRTQCIKSHAASDDTAVPGRGAQLADRHTELHGTDASTCCCYSESAAAVRWGSVRGRSAMLREYCATRACARPLTADSCFDNDLTDCCSVFSRCDCLVIRACSCKAHPDAHGYLGTAPPFSCKRRALLGEVKLHESCANGTLCCSSSVCGDSDFLAIILTVCCSCRSAFNVAVVACTGRALR